MPINKMGGKADTTRHARMIKIIKISTRRKRNNKSVVKKDIWHKISRRLKNIKTMMTRSQGIPVVEKS